ncbi:uncharacterized protein LOC127289480 [Leptopilina boulardi]|uniref:uncharacterized protein LOC127289480 n=1 Tax=Leptopilina boulardi TaxID=63433 RepID=UPI0021F565BE|nr:uncharacterized protein LOC127289480 [Leptopilina boulardi]
MSRKGGRPKHNAWDELCFFPKNDVNGKNVALCAICNKILQNTAIDRLKSHRRTCILLDTVNEDLNDRNNQNVCLETSKMSLSESQLSAIETIDIEMENNNSIIECNKNCNSSISKMKQPRQYQPRIKSFLDVVSEKEKIELNEAFANLFFGCNVDPKVADSDYFKHCIKLLRPGYVSPTCEEISTTLK